MWVHQVASLSHDSTSVLLRETDKGNASHEQEVLQWCSWTHLPLQVATLPLHQLIREPIGVFTLVTRGWAASEFLTRASKVNMTPNGEFLKLCQNFVAASPMWKPLLSNSRLSRYSLQTKSGPTDVLFITTCLLEEPLCDFLKLTMREMCQPGVSHSWSLYSTKTRRAPPQVLFITTVSLSRHSANS